MMKESGNNMSGKPQVARRKHPRWRAIVRQLLLAVLCLLLLVACGQEAGESSEQDDPNSGTSAPAPLLKDKVSFTEVPGISYSSETYWFDRTDMCWWNIAVVEGGYRLIGTNRDAAKDYDVLLNHDFEVVSWGEKDYAMYTKLSGLAKTNGQEVCEIWSVYDNEPGENDNIDDLKSRLELRCGEDVLAKNLDGSKRETMVWYADGHRWIATFWEVYCDGEPVDIPACPDLQYMTSTAGIWRIDGRDYMVMYESAPADSRMVLYPMLDARFGERIEITNDSLNSRLYTQRAFDCDGEYTYFIGNGRLCRSKSTEIEVGPSTSELGVSGDVRGFLVSDGKVIVLQENRLVVLTIGGTLPEREELTISGELTEPALQSLMIEFNTLQTRYRVVYHAESDSNRLNLAMLSNEVDLVVGFNPNTMLERAYAGQFMPLEALLPTDELLANVVDAGRVKGELMLVPFCFQITGMRVPVAEISATTGLADAGELAAALDRLGEPTLYLSQTRMWMLQCFGRAGFSEFMDRENGIAYFDTDAFIKLLTFCGRFAPDLDTVEANMATAQSAGFMPFYQAYDGNFIGELEPEREDAPIYALVGEPGMGRYSGCSISPSTLLAVPRTTENAEGIAEFLRFILSAQTHRRLQEIEELDRLSVVAEVAKSQLMAGIPWNEEVTGEQLAAWEAHAWAYVTGADHLGGIYIGTINQVVEEEAARYFAGDITAEQAAGYIQNRVQLYLDEQG